jgi:hypothetical protein
MKNRFRLEPRPRRPATLDLIDHARTLRSVAFRDAVRRLLDRVRAG